ncbi:MULTISPECIES: transglycosylase domain-containing protein [unclassified Streptomyces]|uniref:transglycosylase domain-containing protein n=1 Tax=unclassified Streptomyces TaxID=2593676 RepID=UPI002E2AAEA9|nr:transglycosylase domain-containing protein [Streptomyces sp. NBC_01429]
MPKKRSGGGLTGTQQAAKFLGVSVLAGAVMAGIAMPAFGALGLAAKGTVEGFDEIPANLKTPPLSQRTTILDSTGGKIATVYSRDRTVVPLKDISPYMQKAIVAIEDSRFYEHGAIDLKGVLRAVNRNAQSGGVAQGASTLTQQYVKNVFVEEAGDDPDKVAEATQQTLGRKIQELKYAIQVEEELGKKKILENYLNITFFGQQAYGIEAAAQRYFSKPAKDLTLPESAMLAGIVQSPTRYDPVNDEEEATKRRNTVLQRLAAVGAVSQKEADKAKAEPIALKVSRPKNGCITAVSGAGFFCDYVRNVFLTDPAFGKTREERGKVWNQGGLTIRTTLDPQAQNAAQDSIKNHVYKTDEVATALTIVEPGTGKILAMGQSRPYGFKKNETQINLSVDQRMGGGAGYQPGSTFKPIVAAAALEQNIPVTQSYPSPYEMDYPSPISTCAGNYVNSSSEQVENEDESEVGPYAMKEAMAKSVNTYFVQMIAQTGTCPVSKLAGKLGVNRADGNKLSTGPAIALGTEEMSPLTMAQAYATFASRGTRCAPIAIQSITGPDKKSIPVPKASCERVMSEKTADTITALLKGVVEDGTGTAAGLSDRPSAGKTGTTDGRYAAWFTGYTPNMATSVWVGDPAHKKRMIDINIGGQYHDKVYGGDTPGPIWRDAMSGALSGRTVENFNDIKIPDPQKDKDRNKPGNDQSSDPGGDQSGDQGGQGDNQGAAQGGDNGGGGNSGDNGPSLPDFPGFPGGTSRGSNGSGGGGNGP